MTDPSGTEKVTDGAMSSSETGKYHYYYNIADDDEVGIWDYRATFQDGTGATAKYVIIPGQFEVDSR